MWLLRKGKNFGGVSSLHGRVYIKTAVVCVCVCVCVCECGTKGVSREFYICGD